MSNLFLQTAYSSIPIVGQAEKGKKAGKERFLVTDRTIEPEKTDKDFFH